MEPLYMCCLDEYKQTGIPKVLINELTRLSVVSNINKGVFLNNRIVSKPIATIRQYALTFEQLLHKIIATNDISIINMCSDGIADFSNDDNNNEMYAATTDAATTDAQAVADATSVAAYAAADATSVAAHAAAGAKSVAAYAAELRARAFSSAAHAADATSVAARPLMNFWTVFRWLHSPLPSEPYLPCKIPFTMKQKKKMTKSVPRQPPSKLPRQLPRKPQRGFSPRKKLGMRNASWPGLAWREAPSPVDSLAWRRAPSPVNRLKQK